MKQLSKEFYTNADKITAEYPKKVHALLPLLHMVQKELGYISTDAIKELAEYIGVHYNHILGVVTFYSMYTLEKRGANYVGVCTNISCYLNGANELLKSIQDYLVEHKIGKDQIHLEEVECLGACGYAPVILFNEKYIENADLNKFNKWISSLNLPN